MNENGEGYHQTREVSPDLLMENQVNHMCIKKRTQWISSQLTMISNGGEPSKEEIRESMKQLGNGKSAGPDNIPAEALKADIEISVAMPYRVFRNIWDEEQVPSEGYLVKLPKKGNLSSCCDFRGITLLFIPGKTFNRILLNRVKDDMTDPALIRSQHNSVSFCNSHRSGTQLYANSSEVVWIGRLSGNC